MNHKLSFFSIDTFNIKYPNIKYPNLCVPKCFVPYVGITAVVGGTLGIMGTSVIFDNYYPSLKK
tara:strand:+ start:865 stop:1056 length:192 start_codon:yes stop_codon:yes gene_type:complete